MARERQSVESGFATPWKPEKEGETVEGTYIGFQKIPDGRKDGKTFKSHTLKKDDGTYIGVSGAMLDQKISRVPKNTYVWITFNGTVKVPNGTAKDYSVDCEKGVKLLDPMMAGIEDNDVPF